MIAAISAVSASIPRPASTTKARTGWAFQPLPNLNRETRQRLGKTRSGWTFSVICTELGYAVHKGRASWDQQRLGIGLKALAKESGQGIGKVRRDVESLAEIGLVVIVRPNILHTTDPDTGRIVTKAKGRCQEALIYLTITDAHLRPARVHRDTRVGITVTPAQASVRVHGDTTVRDLGNQRTPVGDADGIGTPPAVRDAGLPAGQAGGHPAAGTGRLPAAGQEGTPVVPLHAGRDEPPQMPPGRLAPATKAPTRRQTAGKSFASQEPPARSAAEASAEWHRRDPERERQRAEYLAAKAAKASPKASGRPPEPPTPAASPSAPVDLETARQAALAILKKAVPV
jgi:hypothetical protein